VSSSDKIALGVFGKTKGLKGDIHLRLYNPDSDILSSLQSFWVKGSSKQITLTSVRAYQGHFLVKVQGFENIDTVKVFTNQEIMVDRDQLPEASGDQVYHIDLVGFVLEVSVKEKQIVIVEPEVV